jgi:RNA polymerase sigma factor (sigma-70 family)
MNEGPAAESTDVRSMLGSIIDRNNGKWLRFIIGILRNEADAEDVIQEAVRRVLARNVQLPSEDHMRMYLGRAIGNAALELYNSRKRERLKHIPIREHLLVPAGSSNPYRHIEERETSAEREKLLKLLREGLTVLPSKQHEALRLTVLESQGLSIRDIGMHHGIPYSTLRHRSKQGLRHLRKYIDRAMRK